ncbi:type I restriction-modification system, M subunit [Enterococcus sp. DIV0788_1]
MGASEYKNYLLGLIFYKYLPDKLFQQVVLLADESLEEYNTPEKLDLSQYLGHILVETVTLFSF